MRCTDTRETLSERFREPSFSKYDRRIRINENYEVSSKSVEAGNYSEFLISLKQSACQLWVIFNNTEITYS